MAGKTLQEKLEAAREVKRVQDARVRHLEKQVATQERARDNRRHYFLGGGLLALVREGDREALALYRRIVPTASRQQDKDAFAGYEPPVDATRVPGRSEAGSGSAEAAGSDGQ